MSNNNELNNLSGHTPDEPFPYANDGAGRPNNLINDNPTLDEGLTPGSSDQRLPGTHHSSNDSVSDEGATELSSSEAQEGAHGLRDGAENAGLPNSNNGGEETGTVANNPEGEVKKTIIASALVLVGVLVLVAGLVDLANLTSNNSVESNNKMDGSVTGVPDSERIDEGAILYGDVNAPVVADVYFDYMCPHCQTFERTLSPTLKELADNEDLLVRYHPLGMMDGASGGAMYSTRTANAAFCVANDDTSKFTKFNEVLFINQPVSVQTILSDVDLTSIADALDVKDGVNDCIIRGDYKEYVSTTTGEVLDNRVIKGTPAMFINGVEVTIRTPETLTEAVSKIKEGGSVEEYARQDASAEVAPGAGQNSSQGGEAGAPDAAVVIE